jgi:hypothetical protein
VGKGSSRDGHGQGRSLAEALFIPGREYPKRTVSSQTQDTDRMNTAIPLLLAFGVLSASAEIQNAERVYAAHDPHYKATFTYDDTNWYQTDQTGQRHYRAKFWLGREIQDFAGSYLMIATNVSCIYTQQGCYEDSIESLFYAIVQQQGSIVASPVENIGKAIHFSILTVTNSVITNVAFFQQEVQMPSMSTNGPSTATVIFTLDWLLSNEWIPDPDTFFDKWQHNDTNRWSSNLVAGVTFQGARQLQTLFSIPITNTVTPWHWRPQIKIYDR